MPRRLLPTLLASGLFALMTVSTAWADDTGIEGIVTMTRLTGETETCAGEEIYIIPDGKKIRSYVDRFYHSFESGFASIYNTPELILRREGNKHVGGSASDATRLFRTKFPGTVRTKCDDEAYFSQTDLKAGSYFVIAPVFWKDESIHLAERSIALKEVGRNTITVYIPMNYRGGTYMIRREVERGKMNGFALQNQEPESTDTEVPE